MQSPLTILAAAVDAEFAAGRASITETAHALTVSNLTAEVASGLMPAASSCGLPLRIVDAAGEQAGASLTEDFAPFIITVEKPTTSDSLLVLTGSGFRDFLLERRAEQTWTLATLDVPFSSMTTSFLPLGASGLFSPSPDTKSPYELVRENSARVFTPRDVRTWITKEQVTDLLWAEPNFSIYVEEAIRFLMYALANEASTDGAIIFYGPPRATLDRPPQNIGSSCTPTNYNELRSAAIWVYESKVEAEQRHALFSSEFSRAASTVKRASIAFKRITKGALESARLAYQLGLAELSKEAIKAQGDLRKQIADDTSKLADNTRQVITAIGAAAATCAGLLLARLNSTTPNWILATVAIIAAGYVGFILLSGLGYMRIQARIRDEWRQRLYKFIPDEDYEAMVVGPVSDAENMFLASFVVGLIACLIIAALALGILLGNPTQTPV